MHFFHLNTWLRTIYCLQTIHEPACVILTPFQFFSMFAGFVGASEIEPHHRILLRHKCSSRSKGVSIQKLKSKKELYLVRGIHFRDKRLEIERTRDTKLFCAGSIYATALVAHWSQKGSAMVKIYNSKCQTFSTLNFTSQRIFLIHLSSHLSSIISRQSINFPIIRETIQTLQQTEKQQCECDGELL